MKSKQDVKSNGRTDIHNHEGVKYLKNIFPADKAGQMDVSIRDGIYVDVYEVLCAFDVTCPAVQHAIKKLLCAGNRLKGSRMDDLKGALAAINRAIDIQQRVEDCFIHENKTNS